MNVRYSAEAHDVLTHTTPEVQALLRELCDRIVVGPQHGLPPRALDAPVRRCRCGAEVVGFNSNCAECDRKDYLEQRLLPARRSFDPTYGREDGDAMQWCRVGTEAYRNAVARANDAARLIEDPAVRKTALDVIAGRWTRTIGRSGWVLLLGPTGVGKTSVATAVGHKLIDFAARADGSASEHRKAIRFAREARMMTGRQLATARQRHRLGEGDPGEVLIAYDASLLVLDEVGRDSPEEVRDVVFHRARASRPTIMTSSLTKDRFASWIGIDMVRRIEENGVVVDLWGGSR